LETKLNNN
jgi:hypothetical protein